MTMAFRPRWCPDEECICLTGYGERMCVGRLFELQPHGDMFNTHALCLGKGNRFEINDADAFYLSHCLAEVREDVARHDLYHEGRGEVYDLKEGKP